MAAWPIVDAAKNGNTKPGAVYLNIPDFPILTSAGQSVKKTYNELCAGCEYNQLDIGLANLTGAPDQVVSFLRSHPDTKYIIQSTDSVFLGVPAALKAAGLNDVKIFGEGPTSAVQANIASGVQAGTMAFAFYEIMFGAVDAIARAEAGAPQVATFNPPNWILTKDNLPSANEYFPVVAERRWISSRRSGGSSPKPTTLGLDVSPPTRPSVANHLFQRRAAAGEPRSDRGHRANPPGLGGSPTDHRRALPLRLDR